MPLAKYWILPMVSLLRRARSIRRRGLSDSMFPSRQRGVRLACVRLIEQGETFPLLRLDPTRRGWVGQLQISVQCGQDDA
jgi:hypothetical protein